MFLYNSSITLYKSFIHFSDILTIKPLEKHPENITESLVETDRYLGLRRYFELLNKLTRQVQNTSY